MTWMHWSELFSILLVSTLKYIPQIAFVPKVCKFLAWTVSKVCVKYGGVKSNDLKNSP